MSVRIQRILGIMNDMAQGVANRLGDTKLSAWWVFLRDTVLHGYLLYDAYTDAGESADDGDRRAAIAVFHNVATVHLLPTGAIHATSEVPVRFAQFLDYLAKRQRVSWPRMTEIVALLREEFPPT